MRRAYPDVAAEIVPLREGSAFTMVEFFPSNLDGVNIDLFVNYDSSVDMEVGPLHVFDGDVLVGSEKEQALFIAASILEYAATGVASRRNRHRPGRLKPWAGGAAALGFEEASSHGT